MKSIDDVYWEVYGIIRAIERTNISREEICLRLAKILPNQSIDSIGYNLLHDCLLVYSDDYKEFFYQYFKDFKLDEKNKDDLASVSSAWYLIKNELLNGRPLEERKKLYWHVLSSLKSLRSISALVTRAIINKDNEIITFLEEKILEDSFNSKNYTQIYNFALSLFKYSNEAAFNFVNKFIIKAGTH